MLLSTHGLGLVRDLGTRLHGSVAGLTTGLHRCLHVDNLLMLSFVMVRVDVVRIVVGWFVMSAMMSPAASPHNAHNDQDADTKWQEDVKEDDGDDGLTAIIAVVVVVVGAKGVIHIVVKSLFRFTVLERGSHC